MLLRCGLLLAALSCVQPKEDFVRDGLLISLDNDYNKYSFWPSIHNGATLLRFRRANQASPQSLPETSVLVNTQGASEGVGDLKPHIESPKKPNPPEQLPKNIAANANKEKAAETPIPIAKNSTEISNKTPKDTIPEVIPAPVAPSVSPADVVIKGNGTNAEKATKQWDLSPEATKRGLIVFGGFALLAMAYFIFYRTKSKYNEAGNSNGSNESNQFRYGILQSEDRRDNLELSRVPLTMESDEEEDEDLEIFDLEQKKKSLSYVNLQGTDEDIVLSGRSDDGLLLDIEDDNNDSVINWTKNTNSNIAALL